jgi:hypothetical protein
MVFDCSTSQEHVNIITENTALCREIIIFQKNDVEFTKESFQSRAHPVARNRKLAVVRFKLITATSTIQGFTKC